jgi:ABC-type polysaccharide/polyol phosphate export permease
MGVTIGTSIYMDGEKRQLAALRFVGNIFQHRWVIVELVKREVKLRYRGTWLGFFWSLLNPLIMTAVYTLVFQFILKVGIPDYSAFLFCALLPYTWFNESINTGMNCILDHAGYVRDSIFPTRILPVTSIATGMMNYVFALPILIIILLLFKVTIGWYLLALPLVMAVQFLFTLGIVFFLATYNVFFRDLRFIVQNILMALFFITPIMYDIKTVPARLQFIFSFNPITQLIYCYRDIFLYSNWPNWDRLGWVLVIALILVFFGAWVFENHRETFAEYL